MSENYEIEEMGSFFNTRAGGYDKHMGDTVNSFEEYYKLVSSTMEYTEDPIEILDLGCGTGFEIEGILSKAPNANITCIDLSEEMLKVLKVKYKNKLNQINIIVDSYLDYDFGINKYRYIFGVMTMHHFLYDEKLALYKKIRTALLKEGGSYIEGDYVVTKYYEKKWLKRREELLKEYGDEKIKLYHIDIPFSINTQKRLFREAGFNREFNIIFQQGEHFIYEVKQGILKKGSDIDDKY
ncbi:MAG: class I SAM-dependent methyltransferase [Clostridium sp.]|uniref:class I SAM-dependent methyltransferase n=1 Tax=Clostridium sp. TaxID=1506 RepID=UPI00303F7564